MGQTKATIPPIAPKSNPERPTTAFASAALFVVVVVALAPDDVAVIVGGATPELKYVTPAPVVAFVQDTSDGMDFMSADSVRSAH